MLCILFANAVTLLVDRLPSLGIFGNKNLIRDKRNVSGTTEPVISILFAVLLIMGGIQIAVSAIKPWHQATWSRRPNRHCLQFYITRGE